MILKILNLFKRHSFAFINQGLKLDIKISQKLWI